MKCLDNHSDFETMKENALSIIEKISKRCSRYERGHDEQFWLKNDLDTIRIYAISLRLVLSNDSDEEN